MTAPAARTALFPVGPTAPLNFAPGSPERDEHRGRARRGPRARATTCRTSSAAQQVRTGRTRADRHAARAQGAARPGALGRRGRDPARDRRRAGRVDLVGAAAVGGAGRAVPARRGHARARAVARQAQRRDDARAVEDHLPGRHRRGLRDARLHPRQRQEHARHVRRAARPRARASGTRPSTGRSKASSSRSRRSTSPA